MDAEGSRLVTRRSHHASCGRSADGDRQAAKCGVVALLHRCIKGIHVDMDDLSNSRVIHRSSLYDLPYFHIARIRAPTSMRICCALRSEAAAETRGQVAVSKNCSKVAGMKRVLAA